MLTFSISKHLLINDNPYMLTMQSNP